MNDIVNTNNLIQMMKSTANSQKGKTEVTKKSRLDKKSSFENAYNQVIQKERPISNDKSANESNKAERSSFFSHKKETLMAKDTKPINTEVTETKEQISIAELKELIGNKATELDSEDLLQVLAQISALIQGLVETKNDIKLSLEDLQSTIAIKVEEDVGNSNELLSLIEKITKLINEFESEILVNEEANLININQIEKALSTIEKLELMVEEINKYEKTIENLQPLLEKIETELAKLNGENKEVSIEIAERIVALKELKQSLQKDMTSVKYGIKEIKNLMQGFVSRQEVHIGTDELKEAIPTFENKIDEISNTNESNEVKDNGKEVKSDENKIFKTGKSEEKPIETLVTNPNGVNLPKEESGFEQKITNHQTKAPIFVKPSEVIEQVMSNAKVIVSEDKSEMIMHLKPDSLGKVMLKVVTERGEVIAKFMAENEQVKGILESNMQLLKDSLEEQGLGVQELSVSVGGHEESGSENQNGNKKGNNSREENVVIVENKKSKDLPITLDDYSFLANGYTRYYGSSVNITA